MKVFFGHFFMYLVHASFYLEKFGAIARTTTITDAASSSSQIQFNGQYPPTNPSCKPLPIVKDTWNQLKLNDHLKQYPGGDKMTLIVSHSYFACVNLQHHLC
jgi:hypothetical protein